MSTTVGDGVLLGWPVELLDVTIQVATIQPDVCDDVLLVVQVQVAQQGGNGALSWHCHTERVATLWMGRVERLHHIIGISIGCNTSNHFTDMVYSSGILPSQLETLSTGQTYFQTHPRLSSNGACRTFGPTSPYQDLTAEDVVMTTIIVLLPSYPLAFVFMTVT